MKRITILLSIVFAACVCVGAPKVKVIPPCKWAGNYVGVATPTAWPNWWLSSGYYPVRGVFTMSIDTNYVISASLYDYQGHYMGENYIGTISSSGSIRMTNTQNNAIGVGKMGARGAITGSYVIPNFGRGTWNAYRETVLP
jgi:hypothetical protein